MNKGGNKLFHATVEYAGKRRTDYIFFQKYLDHGSCGKEKWKKGVLLQSK